ncbi:hypothetical protein C8F01DRAFT_1248429 [Mycena amicta]|nr:hypothetical protein C8F01DRAFT_1248429 [Mycena amicta]
MSVHKAPPEVLNLILEHCALEKPTLFSCSLVCKAWLPSTRYHLFRKVVLHLGNAGEATFIALLQHPLCTFTTSVRKVWILPAQSADLSETANHNLALLHKLTSVRTLCIHDQKIVPQNTLQVISTAFSDITALTMMLRFRAFSDAVRFMGSFPKLEDLHFEAVRTPIGDPPPDDVLMPPNLHTLYLYSIRGHERWFADHRPSTLTTLTIDHIRPLDDIPQLDEILFGLSLRRLTLRFDTQKGDLQLNVNLSTNTELRYLEIDLSALTKKHIFPVLASLCARNIETIVWRNRRSFDDFATELWDGLDQLLSDSERLRTLNRFEILPPKTSGEKFNPRARMPLSEARGILGGTVEI